jgi:sugar transferase (PEP-CTERM/EpsH1 system associated)
MHSPLVDRYVAVSKDIERYLVRRVRIAPARITTICNGVDVSRFSPARDKPVGLFPAGWRSASPLVIGSVGRIQPVKDHAALVRAFARLVADDPGSRDRLRLAIIGDGPLLPKLREIAQASGVADLAWFPGALDNVAEALRLFDVFVQPSLNEGISNTILEAMASGLPIVATRTGGNVEIVEDGHWGRLFEPGDVSALADRLAEYHRDPRLRHTHATAARRAAVERFSLDAMVAHYRTLYESLLQRDDLARA